MNKNILYRLYAAVFVGMCIVPSALMPLRKNDSSKEKRDAAKPPQIKTEDGKLNFGFFSDFEKYFSDSFAFRSELVTADGRLKTTLMGTSPNKDVIAGRDGWLYYGETVDDFLNINTLSDRSVENIVSVLDMINDYCSSQEIKFVFTVAPDKNSVYPEYMPVNFVPTDNEDNYERLFKRLKGRAYGCDMKKALLEAEASVPLYHKTDTHWNNMGAYVGHAAIMSVLGRKACPIGSSWSAKNDRLGDLAAMIYPAEGAKDVQLYNDYDFTYEYKGRFRGADDMRIQTRCNGKEGSLLMYRDSYGEAIFPYFAETFGSCEFSRSVPYAFTGGKYDTAVIEIVERNIGNIQKTAPFMQAPEADASDVKAEEYTGKKICLKTAANGSFIHVFGELPEEMTSGGYTAVYVTSGNKTFRAFNCFEDKLLGREGEISDRGFSLYIPNNAAADDTFKITAVSDDGKAFSAEMRGG